MNEDNDEELDHCQCQYNPGTEVFCVQKNNVAKFYNKDIVKARENMWKLAKLDMMRASQDFNTSIKYVHDNSLVLVGTCRFLLVAYERVLETYSIDSIEEVKEIPEFFSEAQEDILIPQRSLQIPFLWRFTARKTPPME